MKYIELELDDGTHLYQEVFGGSVIRYCDLAGNTVTVMQGSRVVADDVTPSWAVPDPAPTIPVDVLPDPILTKLDFMNRFTGAELASIYTLAKTEVQVEIWLAKFNAVDSVHLQSADTLAGLAALESLGIIGTGRAQEISHV